MLRMLARVPVVTLGIIAMIIKLLCFAMFFGKTVELGSRYELHVSWTVKTSHL